MEQPRAHQLRRLGVPGDQAAERADGHHQLGGDLRALDLRALPVGLEQEAAGVPVAELVLDLEAEPARRAIGAMG